MSIGGRTDRKAVYTGVLGVERKGVSCDSRGLQRIIERFWLSAALGAFSTWRYNYQEEKLAVTRYCYVSYVLEKLGCYAIGGSEW